jgi:integrase
LLSAFTTAFILDVATIYKRPNSPYWIAQFFDANGKRVNKSTKCPHKGKDGEKPSPTTKRIAAGFEADARKAQKGQSELQKEFSAVIEAASRAAGEEKLTLEVAKAYIEKLHRTANPDFVAVTVSRMFDEWLDSKSRRVSPSTYKLYCDAKRHLSDSMGNKKFSGAVHLLKVRDIEKAVETLKESGLRASTINLSLAVWKSVLRDAVKDDIIVKSPAAGVKGLPTTDSRKRGPFTSQEARAILAVCDNEWRGLVLLAAHTGIRMKDCSNLRKSNIVDGSIIIKPSKTKRLGKVISVPVTTALAAWIEAQPQNVLFPTLNTTNKSTLSEGFKALMKKAGVSATETLPTGDIRTRSFHSLRHSANSWMANAGVDVGTRQEILGHSSAAQNLEYTTLNPETRRKAMTLLPDLMAQ